MELYQKRNIEILNETLKMIKTSNTSYAKLVFSIK